MEEQKLPPNKNYKIPMFVAIGVSIILLLLCTNFAIGNSSKSKTINSTNQVLMEKNAAMNAQSNELKILRGQLSDSYTPLDCVDGMCCGPKECLFFNDRSEDLAGYTTIKGYYQLSESFEDLGGNVIQCDQFVITEANEYLKERWYHILSIDMADVVDRDKSKILNSDKTNQIELGVIMKAVLSGRDAGGCSSPFYILKVY